ncbi:hypothetical protein NXZ75_10665 [Lysinibacillus sphaericus]|uniref:hypothetical protein n=1 Tax=Lysinibacillus sphaericus TaxID=1421 RepID=UPI002161E899|nr:hypothetical protein [Lysinibacillus sphaericus]MCS1382655.1 hypothetical protein [Lysinibacillus sphaericus]
MQKLLISDACKSIFSLSFKAFLNAKNPNISIAILKGTYKSKNTSLLTLFSFLNSWHFTNLTKSSHAHINERGSSCIAERYFS